MANFIRKIARTVLSDRTRENLYRPAVKFRLISDPALLKKMRQDQKTIKALKQGKGLEGQKEDKAKQEIADIDAAILARSNNIVLRSEVVRKQLNGIERDLDVMDETSIKTKRGISRVKTKTSVIVKQLNAMEQNARTIQTRAGNLAKAAKRAQKSGGAKWAHKDKLNLTSEWHTLKKSVQSPYVLRRRGRINVLFLNSMGGSMSRLSKGLMLHEDIVSDCMINAYFPRRHLVYPHETNVFGVFSHDEWREYMSWAVDHYDIIQTTSLPLWPGVAECYDWLTETLGRRHVWRTTGFVHHYMIREDVITLERYQRDLKTENIPSPDRFACKTFKNDGKSFLIEPQTVFYSSPEKGAYLNGKSKFWLPSIRDHEEFNLTPDYKIPSAQQPVKIYVPHHENAVFKGLDTAIKVLEGLKNEGHRIEIITPENATQIWPDLSGFKSSDGSQKSTVYPVPNHMMPRLFSRVDLVIDQIVMGCYGNTGIEAMFSGKPVLGQKVYDEVKDCPVISVTAETLKGEILTLLNDRSSWARIGKAGREYTLSQHSKQAVSKIAADVYRNILDDEKY